MKKVFSIVISVFCVFVMAFGSTEAFAADMEDYIQINKKYHQASTKKEKAELKKEGYSDPELATVMLSRCSKNTPENTAAVEAFLHEKLSQEHIIGSYDEMSEEVKKALLSGEKQYTLRILPCIAQDALLAAKQGQNITPDDIRSSISEWLYVAYVDGKAVSRGTVAYEPEDACHEYIVEVNDGNYPVGFFSSMIGTTASIAEEFAALLEACGQMGEMYAFDGEIYSVVGADVVYVKLDEEQIIYYEGDEALLANTPVAGRSEVYGKAMYLQFMDKLDYNIAIAEETQLAGGSAGGYQKAVVDFLPQAQFILYYRPWVIAGSIILGAAMIGAVVLVIVKKRKTAVK